MIPTDVMVDFFLAEGAAAIIEDNDLVRLAQRQG